MAARATQGSLFTGAERARIKRIGEPIALVLGRLGLSPDALTVAGFGIVLVAALAALAGAWIATAAILVLGTLFDGLDGTLAQTDGILHPLALGDIHIHAAPANSLATIIGQRHSGGFGEG